MDATTSYIHHLLMQAVFKRAFAAQYHSEIDRLLSKEAHAKAITKFGVHYETGYMTNSGSNSTSLRNSTINAFVAYVVLRHTHGPHSAYKSLGLYGGDDGITTNVDPKMYIRVATKMGMKLKAETIHPGTPVPFLGRIFVDPWTTNASIADVPRQLKKLHLTASPTAVPDDLILRRRAEGLVITDPNTPILSEWAGAVIRITDAKYSKESLEVLAQKHSSYLSKETSYASKHGPFPPLKDRQLAEQIVATMLETHAAEVIKTSEIFSIIDSTNELSSLFVGQLFHHEPKIEITAVVNNQIRDADCKPVALKPVKCKFVTANKVCPHGKKCRFEHPVRRLKPGALNKKV